MKTVIGLISIITVCSFLGCQSAQVPPPAEYPVAIETRDWPEATCTYQPMGVPHPTLYVQDPLYEGNVSNDGRFQTFTGENYLAAAASPFIFLGQTIAAPVQAVITPPWQTQCSRGNFNHTDEPASKLSSPPSGMAADDTIIVQTCSD